MVNITRNPNLKRQSWHWQWHDDWCQHIAKERYSLVFSRRKSELMTRVRPLVHVLRNCDSRECHLRCWSCRKVKVSWKVELTVGSHSMVPMATREPSSVSSWMSNVQPLSPQGSFSEAARTWTATLGRRVRGSRTSPQESWADLAARSSSPRRRARAWQASP